MSDPGGSRPCVEVIVGAGQAGVDVLLAALRAALDGHGPAIAPIPRAGSEQYLARLRSAVRPGEPVPAGVAVVISTSGSTGDPAGVLLPARALRAAASAFQQRCGVSGHAWVAALPLHHAGGLMVAVRAALSGGPVVAMDSLGGARPFTVAGFVMATDRARETSTATPASSPAAGSAPVPVAPRAPWPMAVSLVPAMLATLARDSEGLRALLHYDAVLVGGAGTPPELVSEVRAAGVRLLLSYGMSETCGGAVFDGQPLEGVEVTVEPDGRLCLSGDQVALGYRDGRHPERWGVGATGHRWFRTEDLGRVQAGSVEVVGRVDDVVQVAGASVSLGAVADVLRSDPRVAAAEVVALADVRAGARIAAVVVPRQGACRIDVPDPTGGGGPLVDSLSDAVAESLGRPARPRVVRLVKAIPLLESGKPDRAALRVLADDPPSI